MISNVLMTSRPNEFQVTGRLRFSELEILLKQSIVCSQHGITRGVGVPKYTLMEFAFASLPPPSSSPGALASFLRDLTLIRVLDIYVL